MTCPKCAIKMKVRRSTPDQKRENIRVQEVRCAECHRRAYVEVSEKVLQWLAPVRVS